ncbi:MAG TPA: hypothetical protein VNO26_07470 [Candidatus Limnocylindria bacterium]|nr:hypothetical protein [Candidatus Limnocylindria bacterium]
MMPNAPRYRPGTTAGHYESWFLRANHPERPLAFWIRYTVFSPRGRAGGACGELWAIVFDGESERSVAVKQDVPIDDCRFAGDTWPDVRIGAATLESGRAHGEAASTGHTISWTLAMRGEPRPLLLLPRSMYDARLPRAKSLVPVPLAVFDGPLVVDGQRLDVAGWVGSQNHNWGSRHTDHYAWGQVAGFDGHPESFLEVATARLRFGPFWTPPMTPLVLRHAGREHRLNATRRTLRARSQLAYFTWSFAVANDDVAIEGTIDAPRWAVVGLTYRNPPGGEKHCLNTKIAHCRLVVRDRRTGATEILESAHRAAFEILTDDRAHGVPLSV